MWWDVSLLNTSESFSVAPATFLMYSCHCADWRPNWPLAHIDSKGGWRKKIYILLSHTVLDYISQTQLKKHCTIFSRSFVPNDLGNGIKGPIWKYISRRLSQGQKQQLGDVYTVRFWWHLWCTTTCPTLSSILPSGKVSTSCTNVACLCDKPFDVQQRRHEKRAVFYRPFNSKVSRLSASSGIRIWV
jgi:hypothetical protein